MGGALYPDSPQMVAELAVLLAQMVGPISNIEEIDVSGGNVTPSMQDCRGIMCTAGTAIKVDVNMETGAKTEVVLPAGRLMIPMPNITKVYQADTDASNIYLYK